MVSNGAVRPLRSGMIGATFRSGVSGFRLRRPRRLGEVVRNCFPARIGIVAQHFDVDNRVVKDVEVSAPTARATSDARRGGARAVHSSENPTRAQRPRGSRGGARRRRSPRRLSVCGPGIRAHPTTRSQNPVKLGMMIHQGASEFGVSVSAKPTKANGPNSVTPTQHMRTPRHQRQSRGRDSTSTEEPSLATH